jgi:preprotein translocase subunit SecY
MIFASIVARLPGGLQAWWTNPDQVFKVMLPFIALAVVAAVVFMQEGQRRIPIQYAKRVIGRRMSGGGQTYLPLRVNMAGVIPVIFAASIMAFPPTVGQLIQQPWATDLLELLQPVEGALRHRRDDLHHPLHVLLHGGHLQPGRPGRQPQEVRGLHPGSEARQTDGRVPGPHPRAPDLPRRAVSGRHRRPCRRCSWRRPGATRSFYFGGTSLLIVVGVALDTMKQLEAQLMMRNYEGFLK